MYFYTRDRLLYGFVQKPQKIHQTSNSKQINTPSQDFRLLQIKTPDHPWLFQKFLATLDHENVLGQTSQKNLRFTPSQGALRTPSHDHFVDNVLVNRTSRFIQGTWIFILDLIIVFRSSYWSQITMLGLYLQNVEHTCGTQNLEQTL